jgi:predicted dehydrogenase
MLEVPCWGTKYWIRLVVLCPRIAHERVNTGRYETAPDNTLNDRPSKLTVVTQGDDAEVLSFGPADQYACQADVFRSAVRSSLPAPTPLEDAIANMATIDAGFASAATDAWHPVEP